DRLRAAGVDDLPPQRPASLEKCPDSNTAGAHSLAAMGGRGISRYSGLAPPRGQISCARRVRSAVEALLYVGASISFPAGGMDDLQQLGGPAVAGADWHLGLAGYLASTVGIYSADAPSHVYARPEASAGGRDAY